MSDLLMSDFKALNDEPRAASFYDCRLAIADCRFKMTSQQSFVFF